MRGGLGGTGLRMEAARAGVGAAQKREIQLARTSCALSRAIQPCRATCRPYKSSLSELRYFISYLFAVEMNVGGAEAVLGWVPRWPWRWGSSGRRKAAEPGNGAQELKGLGFVLRPSASSIGELEEMTPTTF